MSSANSNTVTTMATTAAITTGITAISSLIEPLVSYCEGITGNISVINVCEYVITSYIPYLCSQLSDEASLTEAQKKEIIVTNLQQAIQAASVVLDKKFPTDETWLNLLSHALNDLAPYIVSLCLTMTEDIVSSSCFKKFIRCCK